MGLKLTGKGQKVKKKKEWNLWPSKD